MKKRYENRNIFQEIVKNTVLVNFVSSLEFTYHFDLFFSKASYKISYFNFSFSKLYKKMILEVGELLYLLENTSSTYDKILRNVLRY